MRKESLSPTPPVECLSAVGPWSFRRSSTSPDRSISHGEGEGLLHVEASKADRHEEGRGLVVGDSSRHDSTNPIVDVVRGKRLARLLSFDEIDHFHGSESRFPRKNQYPSFEETGQKKTPPTESRGEARHRRELGTDLRLDRS